VGDRRDARDEAARLLETWGVGGEAGTGAVMLWNINPEGTIARNGVSLGPGFAALDDRDVDDAVNSAVLPGLQSQDWASALATGRVALEPRLNTLAARRHRRRSDSISRDRTAAASHGR
jgi:hypothetical protein